MENIYLESAGVCFTILYAILELIVPGSSASVAVICMTGVPVV